MSDCLWLSDKHRPERVPDVRFFVVIGQASTRTYAGCLILRGYRTSIDPNVCRMSDSLWLSDKHRPERMPDVRFFMIIGQASVQMCSKRNSETRNLINTWNVFISRKKSKTISSRMLNIFAFLVLLNILSYSFMRISSSDSMFFLPNSRFSKNIFKNCLFCFSTR